MDICITFPAKFMGKQSTITSRNVTVERTLVSDRTSVWIAERVLREQIFCASTSAFTVENSHMSAKSVANVLHVPICCPNICGCTEARSLRAPTVVKCSPALNVCAHMPLCTVAKRASSACYVAAALHGLTISKPT